MYPNVFPNNLTTIYNLVILSNIYEKMIDIYLKITKYQVVVHDNKNLCVIFSCKNCSYCKCHLTQARKKKVTLFYVCV